MLSITPACNEEFDILDSLKGINVVYNASVSSFKTEIVANITFWWTVIIIMDVIKLQNLFSMTYGGRLG